MTVYKLIEIVGTSGTGVDDAVRGAIERARTTLDELAWFEVKEIRGRVDPEGELEYQVKIHLGFKLLAPESAQSADAAKEPTTRAARSQAAQVAAKRGERRRTDLARGFEKQGEDVSYE
jgi:flavin-binding protein dodecin